MRTARKFFLLVFVFLLLSFSALAHQPRIVKANLTEIFNQEVSQAFYGNLNGAPAYFAVNSNSSFSMYFGILVPDVKGIKKDVSAIVEKDGKQYLFLNASASAWKPFFEDYAGDNYFWGPEARANATADNYTITVFSPGNTGRYVLVVGEKELFPPNEMLNALFIIPQLKVNFFNKPFWALFEGIIGKYILYLLIFIVVVVLAIVFIARRLVKRRKKK